MNNKVVVAFVPVLHSGYINFFNRHRRSKLYLLDRDVYGELEQLTREIRALDPDLMRAVISSLQIFSKVAVVGRQRLQQLDRGYKVTMPDEDICRHVAKKYFPTRNINFESVFLRYDLPKTFSQNPVDSDRKIDLLQLDLEFMELAKSTANRSPDWWRQVGAVLVREGKVLDVAYNKHMPAEQSLYALGDPRNNFQPGEHLEISSAHHAEKVLISRSAANGISTKGASLYTSTFPCPSCAYDIATAGIAKVYYSEGYSALEAQETLKKNDVEIIHVK